MEREDKKVFASLSGAVLQRLKSVFELPLCDGTVEVSAEVGSSNFEYSSEFQSRVGFPV